MLYNEISYKFQIFIEENAFKNSMGKYVNVHVCWK